jgi:DNA-directed RNA polymerase specialized sigma24 family protein
VEAGRCGSGRSCHDQLRRDRRAAPGCGPALERVAVDPAGAITNREEMERAFRRLNAEQRAVIVPSTTET